MKRKFEYIGQRVSHLLDIGAVVKIKLGGFVNQKIMSDFVKANYDDDLLKQAQCIVKGLQQKGETLSKIALDAQMSIDSLIKFMDLEEIRGISRIEKIFKHLS